MLNKEDYEEPRCPFDFSRWKNDPPVQRIPLGRVIDKLDEYYNRNDYSGAVRTALYWIEEAKAGRDLAGQFALRNELMGTYRKMGDREKALENASLALGLISEMGAEGSVSEGTALVNAATVYRAFDMPERSYEYFEKAVPIYESTLQPGDERLGGLYNNMAVTLTSLGRYDEAIKMLDRALAAVELAERSEGEQAVSWLNLADAYAAKLGLEKAGEDIRRCCEKAAALLDTEELYSDVNYAFYCEKCAPVFEYYGFSEAAKVFAERAEKIHSGQ